MWKRKETSSLQWIKLRLWTNSIEEAKKQQQQIANLVQTSDSQGSILFGVFIIMNVKSVFFFCFDSESTESIYLFINSWRMNLQFCLCRKPSQNKNQINYVLQNKYAMKKKINFFHLQIHFHTIIPICDWPRDLNFKICFHFFYLMKKITLADFFYQTLIVFFSKICFVIVIYEHCL